MYFKSIAAYLEALSRNPALAMIPLGMVAEWKGVSRSAITEQVRSGRLESIIVKGDGTTWRGVSPTTLSAQAEAAESDNRERQRRVTEVLWAAAAAGRLTTYGEVMAAVALSSTNPRHRAEIGTLLSEVSRDSLRSHGILLSALVVQKGSGRPNHLFFTLARTLGCLDEGADEETFWRGQCDRAFASVSR